LIDMKVHTLKLILMTIFLKSVFITELSCNHHRGLILSGSKSIHLKVTLIVFNVYFYSIEICKLYCDEIVKTGTLPLYDY
jgi:hypothetical protein